MEIGQAVNLAKQCLNTKEVIGLTQTDRKWLGWNSTKLWTKAEGKDKRGMVINEVKSIEEESRFQKAVQQPQQGQWTNWDETYQRYLYGAPKNKLPHQIYLRSPPLKC